MPTTHSVYKQLSDEELFSLTRQNDTKAFQEIYTRHWPALVNAAYKRLESREKAEDIVQNLFLDLYQRKSDIELQFSLRAYLNQALKYKVLNEIRAEMTREKYQKSLFLNPFSKNDFAIDFEYRELQGQIETVLNGLPEKCRRVFILSRRDNRSNKDISADLKISVSTVEKHISKALKSLSSLKAIE